jgi:hypothetical protein
MEWIDKFWKSLHPAIQVIIGGLIVAALIGIIRFVIRLIRKLVFPSPEEKKRIQTLLQKHFNQEMNDALYYLSQRSGLIIDKNRINDTLLFESEKTLPIPFKIEFPLKDEKLEAFKIHFPEIAGKRDELYNRALKLREDNQNNRLNNDEFKEISSALKELSKTANSKLADIRNYHKIGKKEFHYEKRCPICKKF